MSVRILYKMYLRSYCVHICIYVAYLVRSITLHLRWTGNIAQNARITVAQRVGYCAITIVQQQREGIIWCATNIVRLWPWLTTCTHYIVMTLIQVHSHLAEKHQFEALHAVVQPTCVLAASHSKNATLIYTQLSCIIYSRTLIYVYIVIAIWYPAHTCVCNLQPITDPDPLQLFRLKKLHIQAPKGHQRRSESKSVHLHVCQQMGLLYNCTLKLLSALCMLTLMCAGQDCASPGGGRLL